MFGLSEILLIPLVFGAFCFGAGWGQRAGGGILIGTLATGMAVKTMMPGLDVRWLAMWPVGRLVEIAAIWAAVCYVGYLAGSGGWFGRRARAHRGPAPEPAEWWTWIPLCATAVGFLWVNRKVLLEQLRHGGRIDGGVPMAAPPQMFHHLATASGPNPASWGLVLLLVPLIGPGFVFMAAGLANRNLAYVSMGGVLGVLPLGLCLTQPGLEFTGGMLGALAAVVAMAALAGWRWGLASHRLLAARGRPTGWDWDHSRDGFNLAIKRIARRERMSRGGDS